MALIYRNKVNPKVEVEVLHIEVELRVGEIRWRSIVYRRTDNGTVYVRPKAEFDAKFEAVSEK